jgi:hypothetical protein
MLTSLAASSTMYTTRQSPALILQESLFKLFRSHRSGVVGQCQNLPVYSRKQRIIERIQFLLGRVHDFKRIFNHGDGHALYG